MPLAAYHSTSTNDYEQYKQKKSPVWETFFVSDYASLFEKSLRIG